MSTNTTGLSTTLSWMAEVSADDRTGAMAAASEKLHATVLDLRANRHDLELRDRVQHEAWEFTTAWALHRAREDAGKGARETGTWSLNGAETLWTNSGLLDFKMVHEFHEAEVLQVDLARLFRRKLKEGETEVESLRFTGYLLERYRQKLGVEDHLRLQVELEQARELVTHARNEMATAVADSREFVSVNTNLDPEAVDQHGKLEVLLPMAGRMAVLGKGGGVRDRESHRAHMKVTEATRKVQQVIDDRLGAYKLKKEFASLYSVCLNKSVALLEAEDAERVVAQEMQKHGGLDFQVSATDCLDAMTATIGEVRALCARATDTPEFLAPPFVLEHLPRVNARVIGDTFEEILEASPRFRRMVDEKACKARVLLFPGVGNSVFDADAGEVVAMLYPTESRMTSLVGAIGESFLKDEEPTKASYRRLRAIDPSSQKAFSDNFHRDFYQWVKTDWQARRNLTQDVHKWFHHNLIVRRSGE